MPAETEAKREVRAQAKWVRISPRKARVVAEHIRGRSVPEARTVLAFTQRAAAIEINKVLGSAVANAEANHGMRGDELLVSACYVDEGPTIKRFRARARGRVGRINKRTCHITVRLAENPKAVAARPKPKATPKAETKTSTKSAEAKKAQTSTAKKSKTSSRVKEATA